MTTDQYSQLVNAQYGRNNLGESILAALRAIGKDPGNVSLGGTRSWTTFTAAAIRRRWSWPAGEPPAGATGAGRGRRSRRSRSHPGSGVRLHGGGVGPHRGVLRTGELLTTWTQLSHRVTFQQGSALGTPLS